MLGIPLRYLLKHPVNAVADLAADPLEIWTTIHDFYVAQREQGRPQCRYESDDNWEQRLHEALRVPWPYHATSEFWDLWPEVISELEKKKGFGPAQRAFSTGMMAMLGWCAPYGV